MNIDGTCFCGAITYAAEIDPGNVVACHCADCQTVSGAPFRVSARTLPDAFKLLTGEPTIYVKTADSGAQREQGFCPKCGTALYSTAPGAGPKVYVLRLGAIKQRAELTPTARIWCGSQPDWLGKIDGVAATDAQPVKK